MSEPNDRSVRARLAQIYDEARRFKCDTVVFKDRRNELQMAQCDFLERFRNADEFITHMIGNRHFAGGADGYLNWRVETLGLQYRNDDRQIYEVRISKGFKPGWESYEDR